MSKCLNIHIDSDHYIYYSLCCPSWKGDQHFSSTSRLIIWNLFCSVLFQIHLIGRKKYLSNTYIYGIYAVPFWRTAMKDRYCWKSLLAYQAYMYKYYIFDSFENIWTQKWRERSIFAFCLPYNMIQKNYTHAIVCKWMQ